MGKITKKSINMLMDVYKRNSTDIGLSIGLFVALGCNLK